MLVIVAVNDSRYLPRCHCASAHTHTLIELKCVRAASERTLSEHCTQMNEMNC